MRRVQALLMCALLLPLEAQAARLRIVAPSEIQVDPRIAPDRGGLDVSVHVRNDRRLPVRGVIRLRAIAGATSQQLESTTDRDGNATFHVTLGMGTAASVQLRIEYAGTQDTAGSERVVEVTSQYIALELPDVPPIVDIDQETLPVVISVHVADGSAGDREVQLLAGERPLGRAFTDAAGRAVITVPVRDLGPPGVRELVASYQMQGQELSRSAPRRLVVRARATITAERAAGVDGTGGALVGGLSTRLGPISRAPVQIVSGNRVVGATLTDDGGTYAVPLDPELLSEPGAEVRAVFTPSEPWYRPAQSDSVVVTPPPPRSVDWRLASIPACIAALALVAAQVRRRPRTADQSVLPRADDGAALARIADAPRSVCRLRIEVTDASTRRPIAGARAHWRSPDLGERLAEESLDAPGGGSISVRVDAPGYAPRVLTASVARGGEYVLRVSLRTWREELFDRLRAWIRAQGGTSARVLPTPREALARKGGSRAEELVLYVEEAVYGPALPDEGSVQRAETLAAASEGQPDQRER